MKQLIKKLKETESEMEVSIFRLEQGKILGEDEYWRSVKDLMNYCENSRQKEVYLAEKGIIDDS